MNTDFAKRSPSRCSWVPGSRADARAPERQYISMRCSRLAADGFGDFLLPVELLSAPPDLLRRQALDIRIIELPRRIRTPAQRRLHGGARRGRRFERPQGEFEREGLRLRVLGPAGRIAQWKIAEQKARHAAIFDDVLGAAHDDRRDAVLFQMPCGQTHGLTTISASAAQSLGLVT